MNILIIVDPQNDFITGSLPVAGAEQAMNRLAEALPKIPVEELMVTMDCHPIQHCSFEPYGGIWPPHCVKYSTGAAIWEPLMQALSQINRPIHFIEKGQSIDKDQYSAFEAGYPDLMNEAEKIYLCGIAGNVCVLNSLRDLSKHGLANKITVITNASPSLDDGSALKEMIQECGVETITLEEL